MSTSPFNDVQGGGNEDIDLSQVIADSLSSLTNPEPTDSNQNNNNQQQSQLQNDQQYQQQEQGYDNSDVNDVDELENAIGNVFDQFDFASLNDKKDDTEKGEIQNTAELQERDKNDATFDDIDDAIGKAFENAIQSDQTNDQQDMSLDRALETTINHNQDKPEQDQDLDNAIDKAFEDAMLDHMDTESHDKLLNEQEIVDEVDKEQEYNQDSHTNVSIDEENVDQIDNEFDNAIQQSINDQDHTDLPTQDFSMNEGNSEMDDLDLDDAIGNAFKDVLGKSLTNKEDDHLDQLEQPPSTEPAEKVYTATQAEVRPDTQPHTEPTNKQDERVETGEGSSSNREEKREEIDPEVNNSPYNEFKNSSIADADADDDEDLEAAIGNAFSSIFQGPKETQDVPESSINHDIKGYENNEQSSTGESNDISHGRMVGEDGTQTGASKSHDDTDEIDLEEAIGNAFKSIIPQPQLDSSIQQVQGETDSRHIEDRDVHTYQSSLEEHKTLKDNKGHENTGIASSIIVRNPSGSHSSNEMPYLDTAAKDGDEDTFMEDAINEAFKSAMNKSAEVESTENSQGMKTHDAPIELSRIVQNLVSQMSSQDQAELNSNKLPISDNVLQELALEITNQVQAEDDFTKKQKTVMDLPQIDENVLAHFQNEAHREEIALRAKESLERSRHTEDNMHNNRLQAALANVVRNAIESNATSFADNRAQLPARSQDHREADLEQLQMNDILQNAFNMAMENPLDLLSDMEMEDESQSSKLNHSRDTSSNHQLDGSERQLSKASTPYQSKVSVPISSSTATFLESLNRSNDIDLTKGDTSKLNERGLSSAEQFLSQAPYMSEPRSTNPAAYSSSDKDANEATKKSMSIAETLALHRASMLNGPRRDYSSIASLEEVLNSDKVNPIRSQLSSVISSLTSRMNTGGSNSETNLLSVIRQMTNAISSGSTSNLLTSSLLRGVPSVSEIILSYNDNEEKNGIIKSLMVAKQFLDSSSPGFAENSEASSLIDDVIQQFDSSTMLDPSLPGSSTTSGLELPMIKTEHISSISESIISAISNHSPTSRYNRTNFILEKVKTDSPEYKEKIRFENRERKKRWREENAERNKDNDLRSRVLKRAAIMFGEKETPEKKAWTEEEFSRRRDRRIAKQRKDEQEKFNKNLSEDITDSETKTEKDTDTVAALTSDQNLVKPVTDIFNLLSGSVYKENPQAVLAATSAATATAAAIYASKITSADIKLVNSAVSSILMSLMDSAGQHERVSRLSRGATSFFKMNTPPYSSGQASLPSMLPDSELSSLVKPQQSLSSNLFNRISETVKGMTSSNTMPSSLLSLRGLTLHDKRRADSNLQYDAKRPKNDTNDVDSISKIASELDQIRNSISTNTSQIWGSTNALRMPQYRKREASTILPTRLSVSKESSIHSEHPTLVLPESSPFISNRVSFGRDNNITKPSTGGLRKPGSFQKPVSKPDSGNPKGLRFTPLYSAPFKLN